MGGDSPNGGLKTYNPFTEYFINDSAFELTWAVNLGKKEKKRGATLGVKFTAIALDDGVELVLKHLSLHLGVDHLEFKVLDAVGSC